MYELENARQLVTGFAKRNASVPQLKFILDDPENIAICQLTGSITNYVIRVSSQDGSESIIIKHGKPFSKRIPDQPMPLERRLIEYEMLRRLQDVAPNSCPTPYCLDMEDNIIAMEDLKDMKLLMNLTSQGQTDEAGMRLLGILLARLNKSTLRENMSQTEWDELTKVFGKGGVQSTYKNFMLVKTLDPNDPTVDLPGEKKQAHAELIHDQVLVDKYATLRKMVEEEECLVHLDNHQGSIFVGKDRCAVFDLEFSGLTIRAMNLALPLVAFVHSFHTLPESVDKTIYRKKFTRATEIFLNTYITEMPDMNDDVKCGKVLSTTAALVATTIFRWVVTTGAPFTDTNRQKAALMRHMMSLLRNSDSVTTVDQLVGHLFSDPQP